MNKQSRRLKRPHPTRPVMHPSGTPREIDVGLADIIGELWRRGVHTDQCCEEHHPGRCWIAFPDADAALAFCDALDISDSQYGDLVDRALRPVVASPDATPLDPDKWDWIALPRPSENRVAISVEFPYPDLATIRERLGLR